MRMRTAAATFTFASVLAVTAGLIAQSGAAPARYLTPPKAMIDILDAEPLPSVTVGPQREIIALMTRRSMPSIEDVSQPMLRIAGLRINPRTNGPHSTSGGGIGITLRGITTAAERKVDVPANAKLGGLSFSPDGKYLAFENTTESRIDLHIADTATGQSRKVDPALNGLGGCSWLDDSSAMLCSFVPEDRGPAPVAPRAPAGPNVQENYGKPGPVRTYQDLLTSAHDEALFEYYYTGQLGLVDAATGRRTAVGKPGMHTTANAAPNGQFILVERIKRPFSRLLTLRDFPSDVELWTRTGEKVRTIADIPMGDVVPINGVMTGPRSYEWAPREPATLIWIEALDKGDIKNKVPHRDRILTLKAPFTGDAKEVAKTQYRYGGVRWTDDGTILLAENDRATRTTRLWRHDANWGEPRQLWDIKQQDAYGNPGTPMLRPGKGTVLQSGDWIYLTGQGSSPEGDRPFLDRLHLKTLAKERLWRSDATSFESVVGLLADDASKILTRHETKTQPANYVVRDLKAGSQQAITQFKDPHPQITAAERTLVTYKRKDGVQLNGTIYLPPGYQKGTRVPMVLWAYPREFVDAAAASQVTGSPNRFTTISGASHLLMLTQGYAIFDGATMPIIGPGETANDTYVEQLVASAQAAADKAVELGIADRHRIGVGGHSYGAFMTANLLAHSDIFAAGVARSGAYNRTLTPFGFQAETRTFWEVPHIYASMSPFWNAHKINEPILLIHGEADNNSGTFPIQSERLYMALKGHGATVRYVTLPSESHGYAARESILHTLAETFNWFEKYVKNAKPRPTSTESSK